jgi:ATP-dependent DNA ligase
MHFGPNILPVPNVRARTAKELEWWYRRFLEQGFEGLMAKRPDGLYYWGRHSDWHRYKPTITADVKVIAAYEEEDKHGVPKGTLGGVVIEQEDGTISKCGGGFKAAERKKWWTPGKFVMKDARPPKGLRYGPSPLIGHLIEVEAKCRNESGALREPHFVRTREDKE